uniref:C2H2-type domain-containing protein n=1 Tax=Eptatretus burgeri TaxID=7764 RepID=A0A8C4QWI9_EPTBU
MNIERLVMDASNFHDVLSPAVHHQSAAGHEAKTGSSAELQQNPSPVPPSQRYPTLPPLPLNDPCCDAVTECQCTTPCKPELRPLEVEMNEVESLTSEIIYHADGSVFVLESGKGKLILEDGGGGSGDLLAANSMLCSALTSDSGANLGFGRPAIIKTCHISAASVGWHCRKEGIVAGSVSNTSTRVHSPVLYSFRVYDVRNGTPEAEAFAKSSSSASTSVPSPSSSTPDNDSFSSSCSFKSSYMAKDSVDSEDLKAFECLPRPLDEKHKPILMCFLCKLSFGFVYSFAVHAIEQHRLRFVPEERQLLQRVGASAIVQGVGPDWHPLLSFLEPKATDFPHVPSRDYVVAHSPTTTRETVGEVGSASVSCKAQPNFDGVLAPDKTPKSPITSILLVRQQPLKMGSVDCSALGDLEVVNRAKSEDDDSADRAEEENEKEMYNDGMNDTDEVPQVLLVSSPHVSTSELLTLSNQSVFNASLPASSVTNNATTVTTITIPKVNSSTFRAIDNSIGAASQNGFGDALAIQKTANSGCNKASSSLASQCDKPLKVGKDYERVVDMETNNHATTVVPNVVTLHTLPTLLAVSLSGRIPECQGQHNGGSVECPKCDMVLGSSRSLGGHMTMMHSRNSCKTLKCPKCNWHYKYQQTLEVHMKEKHPEPGNSCAYCHTGQPHPRLARGESYTCGYKPFRCDVCNYSTTTKGNLSIHMQSDKHLNNMQSFQNGEGPISEQGNSPAFLHGSPTVIASGSGSTMTVSSMQSTQTGTLSAALPSPTRSKSKPIWRCEVCDYETNVARNLRIHMTSEKHMHNVLLMQHSMKQLSVHPHSLDLANGRHGLSVLTPAEADYQQYYETDVHAAAQDLENPNIDKPDEKSTEKSLIMGDFQVDSSLTLPLLSSTTSQKPMLSCENEVLDRCSASTDLSLQLFQCAVCGAFSTDSLESLSLHATAERSLAESEWKTVLSDGAHSCLLCQYTTLLRANFQLHCKTDKHLARYQLMAHFREGGKASDCHLKCATAGSSIQLRCNACDYFTNSVDKLYLHTASVRHEASLKLYKVRMMSAVLIFLLTNWMQTLCKKLC